MTGDTASLCIVDLRRSLFPHLRPFDLVSDQLVDTAHVRRSQSGRTGLTLIKLT